jgi:hypothetical protein
LTPPDLHSRIVYADGVNANGTKRTQNATKAFQ